MLRSDWSIWQESETRWDDPIGSSMTRIVTPWLKLSEQVQGFNRLWYMTILGRYLDSLRELETDVYEASDIGIRIYYDYEATPGQQITKPFTDFGYDPFDNPPRRPERFQFDIQPNRGRCQAVKLEIFQVTPTPPVGASFTYEIGRGFEISTIDMCMGISPSMPLLSKGFRA